MADSAIKVAPLELKSGVDVAKMQRQRIDSALSVQAGQSFYNLLRPPSTIESDVDAFLSRFYGQSKPKVWNVNIGYFGDNPLRRAVRSEYVAPVIVSDLINLNAEVNRRDDNGRTELSHLIWSGALYNSKSAWTKMKHLLHGRTDLGLKDRANKTALDHAYDKRDYSRNRQGWKTYNRVAILLRRGGARQSFGNLISRGHELFVGKLIPMMAERVLDVA